jgi:hypothetical protein
MAEVGVDQFALYLPREVVCEALCNHQIAGLGEENGIAGVCGKYSVFPLRTNFVRRQIEVVCAFDEAFSIVSETTPSGSCGALVNFVNHGQRHDALPFVLDDVEV